MRMSGLRLAAEEDLDEIASILAAGRRQLAEWSPLWWRSVPGADEIQRLWLAHLLQLDGPAVRVLADGDVVVGCAISVPQSGQWFIDDIGVASPDRWSDHGVALLSAIPERPALTCIATSDQQRARAALTAGLRRRSQYWLRSVGSSGALPVSCELARDTNIPTGAAHTFGGSLDPWADGALSFGVAGAGLVAGSPSVAAPPIYGGGGTVCIVDRVVGSDRGLLVDCALASSAQRGDVVLNVVAAEEDLELQRLLAEQNFVATVDVFGWPRAPRRSFR